MVVYEKNMSDLKVNIEWNLGDFATKRKDATTLITKTMYYVKDHVQNVRLVFDETGTISNATDYFTFGKVSREQQNGANPRYYLTQKQ
jgi:hypothetical protein